MKDHLTDSQRSVMALIKANGISSHMDGPQRLFHGADGLSYTRQVKALHARGLISIVPTRSGGAIINVTVSGQNAMEA